MSEKEIRSRIEEVCADLDAQARRGARRARGAVFPLVLGAGLAVSACSDETTESTPTTATGSGTTTTGTGVGSPTGSGTGSGTSTGSGGSGGTGGGTGGGGAGATGGSGGTGGYIQPPYMAPDP